MSFDPSSLEVISPGEQDSDGLLPAGVGRTPLVRIDGVLAKLECMNPCGSVKDRIACYILEASKRSGLLKPGQPIVEASSGNTGIAFARYASEMGHPVTIVMPEHMTQERKDLIRELGADLITCSEEGSFAEAAAIRDRIAAETGAFNPDQFSNALNVECHRTTTGQEIVRQAGPVAPGSSSAFVAGVGTGGTLIGVGSALREAWGDVRIVAVEPTEAAVMTCGSNGPHGIYGIGDGFIPELAGDGGQGLHPMIDEVQTVSSDEALEAARDLSQRFSLCVGISSGANFLVAQRLKNRFDRVVTVFADGHHKYHSTGLQEPSAAACPFHETCAHSELSRLMDKIERRRVVPTEPEPDRS